MKKKNTFRKPVNLKIKILMTIIYVAILWAVAVLDLQCIFISTIGMPCPGCGMTRAVKAALRFDFVKAFSYHLMFWAVPIMYIYFLWEGRLFENKKIDKAVWIVIIVGFILNWIFSLSKFV